MAKAGYVLTCRYKAVGGCPGVKGFGGGNLVGEADQEKGVKALRTANENRAEQR